MDPTIPAFVPHAPTMQLSKSSEGIGHASASSLSVSSQPFVPLNVKSWQSAEIPQQPVFQPFQAEFHPTYPSDNFIPPPEMPYNAPRGRSSIPNSYQTQHHPSKLQNSNTFRSQSVPNGPQNHHHAVNGSLSTRGRGSHRGRGRGGLAHQINGHAAQIAPAPKSKPHISLDSVDEFPALGGPSVKPAVQSPKSPITERTEEVSDEQPPAEALQTPLYSTLDNATSDTDKKASVPSVTIKPPMSFARIVAPTPPKESPVTPQSSQQVQAASTPISFAQAAASKADSTARSVSGSSTSASTPEDSVSSHSSSHSPRSPTSRTPSSTSDSIAPKPHGAHSKPKGRRHSLQHQNSDNRNGFASNHYQQPQQPHYTEPMQPYWNQVQPPPQPGLSAVQAEFLAANGFHINSMNVDAPVSPILGENSEQVTSLHPSPAMDAQHPIPADALQSHQSACHTKSDDVPRESETSQISVAHNPENPMTALSTRRTSVLHADAPSFVPQEHTVSPSESSTLEAPPACSAVAINDEAAEIAITDVTVDYTSADSALLQQSKSMKDAGAANQLPALTTVSSETLETSKHAGDTAAAGHGSDTTLTTTVSTDEPAQHDPATMFDESTESGVHSAKLAVPEDTFSVEQGKGAMEDLTLRNITETIKEAAQHAAEVVRDTTGQAMQAVTDALPDTADSSSFGDRRDKECDLDCARVEKHQPNMLSAAVPTKAIDDGTSDEAASSAAIAEQDSPVSIQEESAATLGSAATILRENVQKDSTVIAVAPEVLLGKSDTAVTGSSEDAEDSGSEEASKLDGSMCSFSSVPASSSGRQLRGIIAEVEQNASSLSSTIPLDQNTAPSLQAASDEASLVNLSQPESLTGSPLSALSSLAAKATEVAGVIVDTVKTTVDEAVEATTVAISPEEGFGSSEDFLAPARASSDVEIRSQADASAPGKADPPSDQLSEASTDFGDLEEQQFRRPAAPSPPPLADCNISEPEPTIEQPADIDRSEYLPVAEESDVSETSSISLGVMQDDDDTPSLHPSSLSSESTVLASTYRPQLAALADPSPTRNGMAFGASESTQQTPKAPKRKRGGKAAQTERNVSDSDGSIPGSAFDDGSDDEREPKQPTQGEAPSLTLSIFSGSILPRKQLLLSVLASVGINFFLPFVNGVMLGFGEIFARDWLGPFFGFSSSRSSLNQTASASSSRFSTSGLGLRSAGSNVRTGRQRGGAQDVPGHAAAKTAIEAVAQGAVRAAES